MRAGRAASAGRVESGRSMARHLFAWGQPGNVNLGKNDGVCKNYKEIRGRVIPERPFSGRSPWILS